jgi:hypothetical protein
MVDLFHKRRKAQRPTRAECGRQWTLADPKPTASAPPGRPTRRPMNPRRRAKVPRSSSARAGAPNGIPRERTTSMLPSPLRPRRTSGESHVGGASRHAPAAGSFEAPAARSRRLVPQSAGPSRGPLGTMGKLPGETPCDARVRTTVRGPSTRPGPIRIPNTSHARLSSPPRNPLSFSRARARRILRLAFDTPRIASISPRLRFSK